MKRPQSKGMYGRAVFSVAAAMTSGWLMADSVREADQILCTVLDTHVCVEANGCADVLAEDLNVPRFIHVDAKSGLLSTTAASGENRETTVNSMDRRDGHIAMQGVESRRAFSLFIEESTGLASFAAASEGISVSVFGVCTPLPIK